MKATIVLLALLGAMAYVQSNRITMGDVRAAEWDVFKMEFNKNYDDETEDSLRMQIFQDNKRIIEAHNERWAAGEESYEMGVNQFTDLLEAEFNQLFEENYGNPDDYVNEAIEIDDSNDDLELGAVNVDWRSLGAVTPVQNQGHFNTSWAFASAGTVEGRNFAATGRLVALSKQNLIDCCRTKHKRTLNALKYIKKKKGIDTEASYPYRGPIGRCNFKKNLIGATIDKIFQSTPGNEQSLAHNVAAGPVSAEISRDAIRFYKGGVFHNTKCSKAPEYAVLIVGYGHCASSGDYWLLKTSLGTSWGEKGYLRLARNSQNLCGIANRAYFPSIKHKVF